MDVPGHGMTEALRLKELRTKQKSEKARRIFNKQRWDQGQDQDGPRMDAVIDGTFWGGGNSQCNGTAQHRIPFPLPSPAPVRAG